MQRFLTTFILVIAIIPTLVFSQEIDSTAKVINVKGFSLGIQVSPDLCYRRLKALNENAVTTIMMNDMNKYGEAKFGYRVGISASYRFSNAFSLQGGLQYSNEGFRTTGSDLIYGDMIDPRYGFIYDTQPVKQLYPTPDYHYINIPIQTNFYFGKKKAIFVGIGLTTGFLLKTSIQTDNFNTISLSPTFSFGIEPKINDKMYLRFEPQFRYALTSVMDDAHFTAYLWSMGLNISYYYKL